MIEIACRNLSCAGVKERQEMRACHGLIDSLMIYVQSCVAEENPDDKVNFLISVNRTFSYLPRLNVNTELNILRLCTSDCIRVGR